MDIEDFLPPDTLKRSISLNLYEEEIGMLDRLCRRHRCSRPALIVAILKAQGDEKLNDVKPGRRPGGGRKPNGRT